MSGNYHEGTRFRKAGGAMHAVPDLTPELLQLLFGFGLWVDSRASS